MKKTKVASNTVEDPKPKPKAKAVDPKHVDSTDAIKIEVKN